MKRETKSWRENRKEVSFLLFALAIAVLPPNGRIGVIRKWLLAGANCRVRLARMCTISVVVICACPSMSQRAFFPLGNETKGIEFPAARFGLVPVVAASELSAR